MNCSEWCLCCWCSFYGAYCLLFCGALCKEEYDKRIQKYERIRQEYDDLPRDLSLNVEMKIERLITTPLSTIEEEPIGYQDFRMS